MKSHLSRFKLHLPDFTDLRHSWWKILALCILLAIAIILSPRAYCALADCEVKDQWCNEDCSQACGPTQGLGVIVGCSRGAFGCIEDWIPDAWGMRCTNRNDCKVTECASSPPGFGCYLVGDGLWDVGACTAYPSCQRRSKIIDASCCTNQATPCPKIGPKITTPALQPTPAFPLVLGQDPNRIGITIPEITVTAGEHDCRRATISAIEVKLRLSNDSLSWIRWELARRYPGARVLDTYPLSPVLVTRGLHTPTAITSFHFDPLDPGDYEITVTATQDDGQVALKVYSVHVALYESTITH
ncbi:MAG: hypothetical protein WAV05_08690 [Anaerolineales bacterium]